MALLGYVMKQPRESGPVDIDYAKVIGDRTVTSITLAIETPSGMTLDSSGVTGSVAQLFVSGGTSGESYSWTILASILIGGHTTVVEDEFIVQVEEVVDDVDGLADVAAAPVGSPSTMLSRRVGDARKHVIDCSALLRKNEAVTSLGTVTADTGLTVTSSRLLQGRYVEVGLSGGTVAQGQTYTDYGLRAQLTTNRGVTSAGVTVRTYV